MVEDVVKALGFLCLGTRMKRIGERLQAQTQVVIDGLELEISASQFPLLGAIDRLGPLTIGELSEALGVSQPGTTRSVNQLIELDYLQVGPASEDQRRKMVALSPKGQALVDFSKREVWPRIADAVAGLCAGMEGPILDQLAAIEAGLDDAPLHQRSPKID